MATKGVFTPVLPKQGARWQRAGDQTRLLEAARRLLKPVWLLSLRLSPVSATETAGVLLNTCVCESFVSDKRLPR